MHSTSTLPDVITLVALAREAGRAILEVYNGTVPAAVALKSDRSPLTEADLRSHAVIGAGLAALEPATPIVSEEDGVASDTASAPARRYWLVDPLDGTKEFIKRSGEFTVNIALIVDGVPVAGVVHAPVLDVTWLTGERGAEQWTGALHTPIAVHAPALPSALRVVASRDHAGAAVQAMLDALPGATTLSMGSSLKFCLVAEGRADLYFRDGPTMPWDTAAAHAVLRAAGGEVYGTTGVPLRYDHPRTRNPSFVAIGDVSLNWMALLPTGVP
jgi:3'(2'), 5'-bisphosphate nucleotidase